MLVFHDLGERVDPWRRRARPLGGAASSAAVELQGHHVIFSSRLRATSLVAVLACLGLAVSACGGADKAADKPSPSTPVSVSDTPTASPTPSPTATPLSPFEDEAPVKAARAWAVAMAQAVNARDRTVRAAVPVTTQRGLTLSKALAKPDIDHGYYRPGPQPFAPVNVQVKARTARLNLCYLTFGWAEDRKTHQRAEKRKVESIVFEMRKVGGRWKFDDGRQGTGDCAAVTITPVRW